MPRNELFWFQQDGAPAHTAGKSLERIQEHFGPCVLSRLTDIPWPAHSPDLVLNDYYLWGVALAEIRRVKLVGMENVKELVRTYLCSLPPAEVRREAENLLVRACRNMGGGHFKHVLQRSKYRVEQKKNGISEKQARRTRSCVLRIFSYS